MNAAQPGIFAQGARHHYHLEFDLRPDATPKVVGAALAGLRDWYAANVPPPGS